MTDVVGRVEQVTVYPVKSLAGRTVREAEVGPEGLVGDRVWTVVDATTGERVTVKSTPAMAEVVATGDDEADTITLTEVLGRPVRLERSGAPQVDAAAVHLVSRAAVARAAAGDVPEGCSADDPRANLLVDLPDGADERDWTGRTLRVGEVEVEVTRTPKHCLGVYAEVRRPGRVRVGDRVELVASREAGAGQAAGPTVVPG
ncbi:sulfurase [Geodermatophilus sp. TF02-6]|uniref:MOSC N-terminal beta barrel domain-containing protein n=1 Tax=Geodermatophilus sp. TF02-6 TaxID=2250575 RepID=UPI000DE99C17|nr:MOSC N-terminal beta barrel domain-containing protein [Geodermatophilus sp. TF02-6]RBY76709.1 sulfurase [Geodermatophilus sp. TF02-6]